MLQGFKQGSSGLHKCQIDCTNHEEVINKLQVKSKDLYYFWRNYQWLYNKYYNEPKVVENTQLKEYEQQLRIFNDKIEQYRKTIQEYEFKFKDLSKTVHNLQDQNRSLENQNKSLESQCRTLQNQNKSLSQEVNSLLKQLQKKKESLPQLQEDYKREIKRLKQKIQNYKDMEASLTQNMDQGKVLIARLQRDLQSERSFNQTEKRRYEGEILRLEESLDKLRLQIASQPNPSKFTNRSVLVSQGEQITMSFTKIRQQAQQIINSQMERTRNELKQEFGNLIFTLNERELESVLIEQP